MEESLDDLIDDILKRNPEDDLGVLWLAVQVVNHCVTRPETNRVVELTKKIFEPYFDLQETQFKLTLAHLAHAVEADARGGEPESPFARTRFFGSSALRDLARAGSFYLGTGDSVQAARRAIENAALCQKNPVTFRPESSSQISARLMAFFAPMCLPLETGLLFVESTTPLTDWVLEHCPDPIQAGGLGKAVCRARQWNLRWTTSGERIVAERVGKLEQLPSYLQSLLPREDA